MKITKEDRRLQHACAGPKEGGRYNLDGVHFNEKFAVATNGKILAIRRKTSEGIDNTNLKFKKADSKKDTTYTEEISHEDINGERYKRFTAESEKKCDATEMVTGRFPDFGYILENAHNQTIKTRIRIDAAELLKLAKALSNGENTCVEIEITESGEILIVTGSGSGVGVIMPVTSGDTKEPHKELACMIEKDPWLNFVYSEIEKNKS